MPKHGKEGNDSGPIGNQDPKKRGLGKTQEEHAKDQKPPKHDKK